MSRDIEDGALSPSPTKWMTAEQVEGYELPAIERPNLVTTQDHAETFFYNTGINIQHGGEARA